MAFDMKQLRTVKHMLKISKTPKGMPSVYNRFEDKIFVRFGCFYTSNGYSLISVNWDEYEHAGDEEWLELTRFMDNAGKLIKFEFKPADVQFNNNIFEKQFLERVEMSDTLPVNARLLRDVLYIFQINDIAPIMFHDGARWELSGHNRDVSIRAIVMGVRR